MTLIGDKSQLTINFRDNTGGSVEVTTLKISISLSAMKCLYSDVEAKVNQFKRLLSEVASEDDHKQMKEEKLFWPYKNNMTGYRLYLGWNDFPYIELAPDSSTPTIYTNCAVVITLSSNMRQPLVKWLNELY